MKPSNPKYTPEQVGLIEPKKGFTMKIGDKIIARGTSYSLPKDEFTLHSTNYIHNDEAFSTKLVLRLKPLQFETTNICFELHKEYFYRKGREMHLFYLLNPEE